MKTIKLLLFVTVVFFSCKRIEPQGLTINLSTLKKTSRLKIVMSEFKFNNTSTTWNWTKLESIFIDKNAIQGEFKWPVEYKNKFVAEFEIYNAGGKIIASSNDFIYSQASLIAENDPKSKIINANGYEDAVIMAVKGGENNLYANKSFLSPPKIRSSGNFLSKIKNTKTLKNDNSTVYQQWKAYEENVINQVEKYPDYYYTMHNLIDVVSMISNATLEKCISKIDANLLKTDEGKFLTTYLNNSNKLVIGSKFPDFKVNNGEKDVDAKSLLIKGKYYFIDFWASWCGPCREQMQHLKTVYSKIDTNKVQFVSLSVDIKQENWVKASKAENLKWPSYLQSTQPDQNLFVLFCLRSIPQNILIDKTGTIINKNLTENELDNFLKADK
ncbi:TlpA family protein disulfide reductase [Mucilaginibacter rigui]|uniref:TlpA family protein disulfide reductase n=1 Tax=Mucilaginibacter rigui TaxID=534635 RepID=A0ABR7XAI3_9SPHI|nr:TlpA disulfide reductase family protein [Mucilaginibacter rigui]MBD1386610.1 TlpA family protein disulfide reductase [Mucilaginibacter rigui]